MHTCTNQKPRCIVYAPAPEVPPEIIEVEDIFVAGTLVPQLGGRFAVLGGGCNERNIHACDGSNNDNKKKIHEFSLKLFVRMCTHYSKGQSTVR